MKTGFMDLISASIEWTREMLFRPFNFKKWFFLFIIVMLAGQLQGGCNSNFSGPGEQKAVKQETAVTTGEQQKPAEEPTFKERYDRFVEENGKAAVYFIVLLIAVPVVFIVLVFFWIGSIFAFVLIESIVKNDASIKEPFKRNLRIGNTYFLWNMAVGLIEVGVMAFIFRSAFSTMREMGVFQEGAQVAPGAVFSALLPVIGLFTFVFIIAALINFFITDYVVVIMYKKRLSVLNALGPAYRLLTSDAAVFAKYLFVKIGLALVTAVMRLIVGLGIILILLIPGIIIGLIVAGITAVLPGILKALFLAPVLFIAFVLLYFLNILYIPFPIFLKTFNLKFIAELKEDYNVWGA